MNLNNRHASSTAILLFAQSDAVDSALKPIASTRKQNDLLWHNLNQKVLKTIKKTSLPFFVSNEKTQQGIHFGDKLSHAVQSLFDKGFEKVIIVGNDSPGLTTKHFEQACNGLTNNDLVLGPDYNGGTYLIAISRSLFNKEQFANIDWQSKHTFTDLKNLDENGGLLLQPLSDFNTLKDLRNVVKGFSFYSLFIANLLSLLWYQHPLNRVTRKRYTFEIVGFNFNKGSPVLV
ncbi:TIGR04282 family arsenosugar biosynthesis glycosyltransferase [Flavobacterium frigidarium]|jgi:glycosyltransferase A (GT-A) superfamily protein (DUF2064 family)|uniref:DUF2064 domain-containing protein n=1 Tax=Flavobacterium frigidarium TaxID=99286 RepID=A0ABV4KE32_9FLAO